MKLRSALLAATVMVAPVAAKAQAINGLYIGAGVGANFEQSGTLSRAQFPALGVVQTGGAPGVGGSGVSFDTGFVALGSVGYGLGNGLRVEVEGNFRTNKFSHLSNGPLRAAAGGERQQYGGLINVLYDIDPTLFGFLPIPLNPYVGVGAGAAYVEAHNTRFYGSQGNAAYLLRTGSDGDVNFAYQAIIGTAVPIGAVPGLSLTFEYRFFGVLDDQNAHFQYLSNQPRPAGTSTRANLRFQDDYNHSLLVGVRYAFNAAPPPVAPVAPLPPQSTAARTYLVFFDWDRADLTDRARQIIGEAASATTKVQVTRIMVNGNTDTTGTARYNQGLSVRRAQNVAAELVRDGVPRSAITTQGFGFSRLLVPTGPGVREPQNRRVEIILQ